MPRLRYQVTAKVVLGNRAKYTLIHARGLARISAYNHRLPLWLANIPNQVSGRPLGVLVLFYGTTGAIYIVIWVVAIWAFFRMFRKN